MGRWSWASFEWKASSGAKNGERESSKHCVMEKAIDHTAVLHVGIDYYISRVLEKVHISFLSILHVNNVSSMRHLPNMPGYFIFGWGLISQPHSLQIIFWVGFSRILCLSCTCEKSADGLTLTLHYIYTIRLTQVMQFSPIKTLL